MNLDKVKDILRAQGANDEQILQVTQGLLQAAYDQLYVVAMASLNEEDLQVIDKCINQEEANKEILKRFSLRTGKNPDEIIQQFLSDFSDGFLRQYEQDKKF